MAEGTAGAGGSAAAPTVGLAGLWGNPRFSDVVIIIRTKVNVEGSTTTGTPAAVAMEVADQPAAEVPAPAATTPATAEATGAEGNARKRQRTASPVEAVQVPTTTQASPGTFAPSISVDGGSADGGSAGGAGSGDGGGAGKELKLHATLLIEHSRVLASWLLRDSKGGSAIRLRITTSSDTESKAVEDLLWMVYHGRLPADGDGMTGSRVLALLQAADWFQVPTAADAISKWLAEHMDTDTATAVHTLSPGAREMLPPKVQQQAWETLLEPLCNLELSMDRECLRVKLLSLPEAALVALLSSDAVRVAAESTVAAVAMEWAAAQGMATVPDAIAYCVRVTRLQPEFMATAAKCFPQWTVRALLLVQAYRFESSARGWDLLQQQSTEEPLLTRVSTAPRRASGVKRMRLTQKVPLGALAAAFLHATAPLGNRSWASVTLPDVAVVPFGGYTWSMYLEWRKPAGGGGFKLGVFLRARPWAPLQDAAAHIAAAFTITCPTVHAVMPGTVVQWDREVWPMDVGRGRSDFFSTLAALQSWDEAVFEPWVGSDKQLTFRVEAQLW